MSPLQYSQEPKAPVAGDRMASSEDFHGETVSTKTPGIRGVWQRFSSLLGVEMEGNEPLPAEEKTERRYINLCSTWFSMNFNLLSISTGMAGTIGFGLGLRDATLVIIFFSLATALAAPYLSIWGAKLGLRQMIHARYAFGLFGTAVPLILNMATLTGYAIIGSVIGGQVLSAINPSALSVDGGIVIVALLNLVIVFIGGRFLHQFDRYAWIPTFIATVIAVGCGGEHLHKQADVPATSASAVLSFAATIAGFFLPWATLASDLTVRFDARSKPTSIFLPAYVGLTVSSIPLMILGAAIGGAVPNVPSWEAGYLSNDVGGVMDAMLERTGGFGKFLLVLLALSVLGNASATVYALSLNFQNLLYLARVRIPRVVYTIVATAIIIPVAIVVARNFFSSLMGFLGIIGSWPAAFIAIVVLEHLVIRKGKAENYDLSQWESARGLPSGIAALGAGALSFALVIPSMNKEWYVGPIGEVTGDIGFEMAMAVSALLYLPFRMLEIKMRGHV